MQIAMAHRKCNERHVCRPEMLGFRLRKLTPSAIADSGGSFRSSSTTRFTGERSQDPPTRCTGVFHRRETCRAKVNVPPLPGGVKKGTALSSLA